MPEPPKVNAAGGVAVHPAAPAEGVVVDSVMRYPVTALSGSVAVNVVTLTVRELATDGMVKAVIVGGVISVIVSVCIADVIPVDAAVSVGVPAVVSLK